jgi:serine/threonine protein kinase
MGEVYRARNTRLGREVAVKVLPHAFSADPERLARFEQEARAVAALSHPNILALFDALGGRFISPPDLSLQVVVSRIIRPEGPLANRPDSR